MSDILDKIGKLLAQAERTDNEAERDAFVSKAQNLATAYSIDLAVARQRQADKTKREVPTFQRIHVADDSNKNKAHFVRLFTTIAEANDLKCLIAHRSTFVEPYGFPSDIEVTERLFASLSVQMVAACDKAISAGEHQLPENRYWVEEYYDRRTWEWKGGHYRTDARVFRSSFYQGFISAIRERLQKARQEAIEAAKQRDVEAINRMAGLFGQQAEPEAVQSEAQSTSTELVLKAKEVEVRDFFNAEVKRQGIRGSWKGGSSRASVGGAHRSGREAGQRASLGGGSTAIGGSRRAIA